MSNNDPKANDANDFDHLVYVRLFEGCNLACEHCFIPANPKKMSEDQLKTLPESFKKFAKPGQKLLIQWHGGEPTMLGPKLIRSTIEHWIAEYPEYTYSFGIQTNLMNYDESWASLYRDHFDSKVGISWDPKIRLIRKDKPETNSEFESIFWKNVDRLAVDKIEPYMVVTGTRIFFETFTNPVDFFELLEKHSIPAAHIERLTKTGVARDNWGTIGLTNREYSNYMLRFSRAYFSYRSIKRPTESRSVYLSPFDGLKASLIRLSEGLTGGSGCLSGVCDTRFHTFDSNGYKKGCTALTSESDNKNSGVQVIQIMDYKFARKLRQQSCDGCEFMPICSSGCLASEKWDESEECSGSKILFKGTQDILIGH